jgi:serine protease inhibitor ecotin
MASSSSDTLSSEPEGEPWHVTITDIDLRRNSLVYRSDLLPELRVDSLRFTSPMVADTSVRILSRLDFMFASGGEIAVNSLTDLEESLYHLHVVSEQVNLNFLKAYCDPFIRINRFDGLLNSDFRIMGSWEDTDIFNLGGMMQVESFQMDDQRDQKVLACEKLSLDIDSIQMKEALYNIHLLEGAGLYALYEMDEISDNWSRMMISDTSGGIQTDTLMQELDESMVLDYDNPFALMAYYIRDIARSYQESEYNIRKIAILDSKFDFNDYTTSTPFRYELSDLELRADSLDSDREWLRFDLSSVLNRAGTLDGFIQLATANLSDMDVYYEIHGTDLSPFSPYTGDYVDYPIITGDLHYVCDTRIRDGKIVSSNVMDANQFNWGERLNGNAPYNLPVKLAVSLLKDIDGNIHLDVPIEGDLNDPTFKLGKVIWNTVKNILVKAVTAPYRLLARTFSVDEDRLKQLHFGLLERELNKDHQKQMGELAKVLKAKPELNVEFKRITRKFEEAEKFAIDESIRAYLFNGKEETDLSKEEIKEWRSFDVRDSLFGVWMEAKVPEVERESPVQRQCLIFIGEENAIAAVDKIGAIREGSIRQVLTEEEGVAEDRIRMVSLPQDSLKTSRSTAVYDIGYWVKD